MEVDYLAAGANRHPATADWNVSGVLAYGANNNIALWRPLNAESQGVYELLSGHTDTVNAVKFLPNSSSGILLSGSVDKTVRIWIKNADSERYSCIQSISDHGSSINCLAVTTGSRAIFASGSADSVIKIWSLDGKTKLLYQNETATKELRSWFGSCYISEPQQYTKSSQNSLLASSSLAMQCFSFLSILIHDQIRA